MRRRTTAVLLLAGLGLLAFVTLRKSEPKVLWVRDFAANWSLPPAIGPDGTIYFADETNNLCAVTRDGSMLWKTLIATNSPTSFTAVTWISVDFAQNVYAVLGKGQLVALGLDGKPRWSRDLGVSERAGVAFGADNTLYVGGKSNTFYALSPDGSVKWQFRTLGEKIGGPVIGRDGTIYFGCSDTNFYALNPDGTLKWVCTNRAHHISRPIVATDGTIYVDIWPQLYSINADGAIKWSATNAGVYTILDGFGTLYACGSDGVVALHATGTIKWKYRTDAMPSAGLAVANDGTIYFASYTGGSGIDALDRNGKLKWRFWRPFWPHGFPLWARIWVRVWNFTKPRRTTIPISFTLTQNGRIYAIMADSKVYALEVSSGLATNAPWPMFKHDVRHSGGATVR